MTNMSNNNFPKGSEWRKWDLHIHSPLSILSNNYKKQTNGEPDWERYLQRLENLDISVLGITDYFTIEGYKKILEFKQSGRLANISLILPNIEFRLDSVISSRKDGKEPRRLNFHVIFSNEVNPKDIEEHFLQDLSFFYEGNPQEPDESRKLKLSNLSELGKTLISEHTDFNGRDPLELGASCAVVKHQDITEILTKDSRFKGKYLLVLPEELSNLIDWEGQDHLIRKGLLQKSDMVFSSNPKTVQWCLGKDPYMEGEEKFKEEFKTLKPCIHGSDSHDIEQMGVPCCKRGDSSHKCTSESKDCELRYCWIKADPTFEGLKQITYEPGERVFIGVEPEVELRAKSYPRRYIKTLVIGHDPKYTGQNGKWFYSESIDLNKELVAIIGNKGSGKSALTDIVGLLGNSHNQIYNIPGKIPEELFSFLNKDKFLKSNLASNFVGELHWYSGNPDVKHLNEVVNVTTPESVEYLPQKYLEKICSNINDDEFRQKLNQVIFAYVEEKDRYGNDSLEDLIKYLSRQTEADIDILKVKLSEENGKVIGLESKLTSDYINTINAKLKLKKEELEAHIKIKPLDVPKPVQNDKAIQQQEAQLKQFETEILPLKQTLIDITAEQGSILKTTEDLKQLKTEIERQVGQITVIDTKYHELLQSTGLVFSDFVEIKLDFKKLNSFLKTKSDRLSEINQLLLSEGEISKMSLEDQDKTALKNLSLRCKLEILETKKREYIDGLDKASQIYQKYLKDLNIWENRLKTIEGDPNDPSSDTVNWFNAEILKIKSTYPEQLKLAREARNKISEEIFTKKLDSIQFYNSVKQTIDNEIHKYQGELNDYNISIDVSMRMQPEFTDEFFRFINQGVKGSFYGTDDGRAVIKGLLDLVNSWKNQKEVFSFLESMVNHIDNDLRTGIQNSDLKRDVFGQMKATMNAVDLYDFIFGLDYLETKYDLRVDNKDLNELSPGERGGLLLIFYLMLDKKDLPLIIDQPEDNLDNKSVYQILVKFLKRAKKRRQIIMVTHNPNLAVVADAEQLIHVSIDKKNGNDFDYVSGAIENPIINGLVVDILEGTMPAFDNRKLKYRKQPVI